MKITEDIVLPTGFTAVGLSAGIKKSGKKDLAILYSDRPATAAGCFTTNQVRSATVRLDAERVRKGRGRAIVVNAGNANACTGARGMRDARRMGALTAQLLGVPESEVYVASTGPIGVPMPMDLVEPGIRKAVPLLKPESGADAADAIMTTDTRPKRVTVRFRVQGKPVTLSAMAKGAGMIHPNMATMLCFVCTDAAIQAAALRKALRAAVAVTFNRISVDGDQSTNDTVLVLANGAAGHKPIRVGQPGWADFQKALTAALRLLALKIARDGEGARKLITVRVKGARNDREADAAARSVANSLLVKTCWHGDYPNWGRILDAVGYSRAKVDENRIDLYYDDRLAVRNGCSAGTPVSELSAIQSREAFTVTLDLKLGKGVGEVYTCDCSEEYVRINVDYVRDMTGRAPT